jgi:hypothetical protein
MRNRILTAVAVVGLVLPTMAQGQTANATVTASATVQASLTAATTNQLNFGTLTMGTNSTIGSAGAGALSGAGTAGRGQVQVTHNSNVAVSTVLPTTLRNSSTNSTLGFAGTCATTTSTGGSGTAVADCASFMLTAGLLGTNQESFILVGGTVSGNSASGIGTFSGDVVFTFTAVN